MQNISQEDARKFLCDVMDEKCFWVNNGPILKNIEELSTAVKTLNDETFNHHLNSEKNDFSRWIDDVIGDKKLANDIAKTKTKKSLIKKLDFRINQLKRAVS